MFNLELKGFEGASKRHKGVRHVEWQKTDILAGLHLVSTPIGTARDITLRALDILASCDVLVAEDTRTLRHLMEIHGVPLNGRSVLAYHDHNGPQMRPKLLRLLSEGKSLAYASEAGTPLVADPGYGLAREAIAAGHTVHAVPGASAVLAALTVSGLPTDRFLFAGFPPTAKSARRAFLKELAGIPATLVLYESPKRISGLLTELIEICGSDRHVVICRELTKRFEEIVRGPVDEVAEKFATPPKGEVVVLIDRAGTETASADDVQAALASALASMSLKDAAEAVSTALGLPKREVYQTALKMSGKA